MTYLPYDARFRWDAGRPIRQGTYTGSLLGHTVKLTALRLSETRVKVSVEVGDRYWEDVGLFGGSVRDHIERAIERARDMVASSINESTRV